MEKKRDWCTMFPDTVRGVYIGDVCEKHDRRYENTRISRYEADILLYRDVKRRGLPLTAGIMFLGVRAFGWLHHEG